EREGRDEQHYGTEDGPIPAAEGRDCKRIGKSHERADQSRQCHELEQLVRRVMEAGLRQFGCDDAPDEPDRKTEMLGKNRPYEITSRDEFAFRFPKLLILWVPVRNPRRVALAHQRLLSGWARFSRSAGSHLVAFARPVPTLSH